MWYRCSSPDQSEESAANTSTLRASASVGDLPCLLRGLQRYRFIHFWYPYISSAPTDPLAASATTYRKPNSITPLLLNKSGTLAHWPGRDHRGASTYREV